MATSTTTLVVLPPCLPRKDIDHLHLESFEPTEAQNDIKSVSDCRVSITLLDCLAL